LNADGDERLTKEEFFRQLLRLVYRLIFVMTAEDREILHPNAANDAARPPTRMATQPGACASARATPSLGTATTTPTRV
jgi:hypothetical protein